MAAAPRKSKALTSAHGEGWQLVSENGRLAHRFEPANVQAILSFDTAERTQGFTKQIKETPLMASGEFSPLGTVQVAIQQRRMLQKTSSFL